MAAFNGSIVKEQNYYTLAYRALSLSQLYEGVRMKLSTIGIAQSGDGIHFRKRRQLIVPEKDWERFGCEDPRITKLDDTYYIFYTALSSWPPHADHIKVALATTKDLKSIDRKYLVTPFNAKAMALFPKKIAGKITALLTVHTDRPPAKICLARVDSIEQLWDQAFWATWYKQLEEHVVPIAQEVTDHLEVGVVPVATLSGWILVFAYIENYYSESSRIFRIDAALLDRQNPQRVIGQTLDPLLVPEAAYEFYGMVPNVIFPTGTLIEEGQLFVYYSACDTTICRASITLSDLLAELTHNPVVNPHKKKPELLARFEGNPILSPIKEHPWESKYTFNAGALYVGNRVHILYRAMGDDDTSQLGYAVSRDGLHIDQRFTQPVYKPREGFEIGRHPGFSGCEDPRLTTIGDTIYMCYTAFDGENPPRIALCRISIKDFLKHLWHWTTPQLISAPGMDNKDSCIMSEKIGGKYIIFHRIPPCIWVDVVDSLSFGDNRWLGGHFLMGPRPNSWDSLKIGLNGPPVKTSEGWLLLYHGVSRKDQKYRMGAALLDVNNPLRVLARLHNPILEPLTWYENEGYRPGTVFSNGHVVKDDILYVYYGGADTYTAVATAPLSSILGALKKGR